MIQKAFSMEREFTPVMEDDEAVVIIENEAEESMKGNTTEGEPDTGEAKVTISGDAKNNGGNGPGSFGFMVERLIRPGVEVIDWGLNKYLIPKKWEKTKGKGIVVAVLDTGISQGHPDFFKKTVRENPPDSGTGHRNPKIRFEENTIIESKDFTGSDFGAADLIGHGTHVAGIIAAKSDGEGVVGVAPEVKLLIGKVIGDDGIGTNNQLARGIEWATDYKKEVEELNIVYEVDIISMSLQSDVEDDGVHHAIQEATKKGIIVICAAGNNMHSEEKGDPMYLNTVKYPALYPETISVGAIDRRLKVTRYSADTNKVDLVAPGDEILSTYPPRQFAVLSGTSMAAPFAAGVTALILSEYYKGQDKENRTCKKCMKKLDREALIAELKGTALNVSSGVPGSNSGFGLINPEDLIFKLEQRSLFRILLTMLLAVMSIGFSVYVILKYIF